MPNIHHELVIASNAQKIYDAISTQEGLSGWWTPDTRAVPEINSISRFNFGPTYFKEMKITELQAPSLVKWVCLAGDDQWVGTSISFALLRGNKEVLLKDHGEIKGQLEQQNAEENTLLIFHHDNWAAYSPMYAECNYTWAQFLRSLKLFCETGEGRPWPNQHRV